MIVCQLLKLGCIPSFGMTFWNASMLRRRHCRIPSWTLILQSLVSNRCAHLFSRNAIVLMSISVKASRKLEPRIMFYLSHTSCTSQCTTESLGLWARTGSIAYSGRTFSFRKVLACYRSADDIFGTPYIGLRYCSVSICIPQSFRYVND